MASPYTLDCDSSSAPNIDLERDAPDTSYLSNHLVKCLDWNNVNVSVNDKSVKGLSRQLLHNVSGQVLSGETMAIMGPSGSGKTTLLNTLAFREASTDASASASVFINGQRPTPAEIAKLVSYVECDDALIGSLTVRETLQFAARLSLAHSTTSQERMRRVDHLLKAFGLVEQQNTIIGTLVRKGVSTGQRRRVSVAAQLISAPRILFLDEPTSGLDSEASYHVMAFVRSVARANNLIIVASIHQPSTTTFQLFDKVLLLSGGRTCYCGRTKDIPDYFAGIGMPLPMLMNPADYMLRLVNIDFEQDAGAGRARVERLHQSWAEHAAQQPLWSQKETVSAVPSLGSNQIGEQPRGSRLLSTTLTLMHRSWIKSQRDVLVYWLRFGMYLGLAIMMGTVWLRLPPTQSSLQPFANCILFGSTFMSFMAVVYVPAYIEDRMVCVKDRANGLYGSTAFMVSNFLVGLPYLFLIAISSSTFVYWMVNFLPDGSAFMIWVMWMYLNLVAAESLVVLMSSLFPNFVGALALTAMANGIWMACNGFMVPVRSENGLNPFYHYVFYYINYQAYVFRGLISNELSNRNYSCATAADGSCFCSFDTPLRSECLVEGSGVLETYGFSVQGHAKPVGITIAIIAGIRLLGWLAMYFRRQK